MNWNGKKSKSGHRAGQRGGHPAGGKPADREHPLGHEKTGVILMGIGIYAINTTDADLSD